MKVLFSLIIFFIFSMGINSYRFGYDINETFYRTLLSPMEGTVWAEDYTEDGFAKVKIGMTASEVHKILGEPLVRNTEEFWKYTLGDTSTADFDQRWVVFNDSGIVVEKRKSFFID